MSNGASVVEEGTKRWGKNSLPATAKTLKFHRATQQRDDKLSR